MLGVIEGSAGGLTFASRGGLNTLRQKVGKNSSKSPAQVAQRTKFGALGRLSRMLGALLVAGYRMIGGRTGYNVFSSVNSKIVTLDSAGLPLIDYALMEISSGSVTPLVGLAVAQAANGQTVSWTDNSNGAGALANDKVYLAIVRKSTGQVFKELGLALRSAATITLADPALVGVAATDLAVFAFAKRAVGQEASNTTRLVGGTTTTGSGATYGQTLTGPSATGANTTITSSGAEKYEFNELTSGTSGPYNMVISVGGVQKASIDTFDRYAGRPFRFTEANGTTHTGVIAPTVNF